MNETFGQRFLRLRKAKGLTQDDIARKVNVSSQAVSKWENDFSSPDISILGELANILGVDTNELLGIKKEDTKVVPIEERKDVNQMILRINVLSQAGDKVKVNLPVSIIKICLEGGLSMPSINGNDALKNINFEQIFRLIEQGVVGQLVEVESADGDIVTIGVE